jgi:HTH-type transcriptional regulator / antitoxin HipB
MHSKLATASVVASEVGTTVQRERNRLGLRQDELALMAGVSTRVVHQVEAGKATSRLDSVVAVLAALGLALKIEHATVIGGDR